ncbi:MAG: M56 family metallopeptidase [Pirellulales bacterium]|nr:M56 family metallopeptidase [Pirellulales bacterium]
MTLFTEMFSLLPGRQLGWTLLHSLWQFAVIGFCLWGTLALLRRRSANLRYVVSCGALAAMLAVSVLTFYVLPGAADSSRPLAASSRLLVSTAEPPPLPAIDAPPSLPRKLPGEAPGLRPQSEDPSTVSSDEQPPVSWETVFRDFFEPWMPWLSLAWLVGVAALSVRNLGGWIGVRRLRRSGVTPVGAGLALCARSLVARMKISRPVRVLQSALVEVPVVVGWLRPAILLPASLLSGLSIEQLEAILAHELAHVRRHDYLLNLLQTVVETLLFYHPAVWWVSRRIRTEREHCCDDAAVRACGSKLGLGEALTLVAAARLEMKPALAVSGNRPGGVLCRVRRLLDTQAESPRFSKAWAALLVLVFLGAALTVGWGRFVAAETEAGKAPADDEQTQPLDKEERDLLDTLVALNNRAKKQFPDVKCQAVLYHVRSEREIDEWKIREFQLRDGKVEWGSSRLSDAQAVFYRTDGTRLESSWKPRGDGMHDISIDVAKNAPLFGKIDLVWKAKYNLNDLLLTPDGKKKSLNFYTWEDAPAPVIVRMDKPLEFAAWSHSGAKFQSVKSWTQQTWLLPPVPEQRVWLVWFRGPFAEDGVKKGASDTEKPAWGKPVQDIRARLIVKRKMKNLAEGSPFILEVENSCTPEELSNQPQGTEGMDNFLLEIDGQTYHLMRTTWEYRSIYAPTRPGTEKVRHVFDFRLVLENGLVSLRHVAPKEDGRGESWMSSYALMTTDVKPLKPLQPGKHTMRMAVPIHQRDGAGSPYMIVQDADGKNLYAWTPSTIFATAEISPALTKKSSKPATLVFRYDMSGDAERRDSLTLMLEDTFQWKGREGDRLLELNRAIMP